MSAEAAAHTHTHVHHAAVHWTHIEGHFQNVLGDLHDTRVSHLACHADPRVGRRHGVTELLNGNNYSTVRDH